MTRQLTWVRWTWAHTLLALLAAVVPLATGIAAFFLDGVAIGNWNAVELTWTFWGAFGLVPNTVKLHLLCGDLRAIYFLRRDWRRKLGGWWTFLIAVGFELAFLMFLVLGYVSGQLPSAPVQFRPGGQVPASFISGAALIVVEAALIGLVVFTLMARVVLGHRGSADDRHLARGNPEPEAAEGLAK